MEFEIFLATTDDEINACFAVVKELRPQLEFAAWLPQVRRQQQQSYQVVALRQQGEIKSVAGFRFCEFLAWGKLVYIDDLSTLASARNNGFANALLNWVIAHAKSAGCNAVHLDSGYARHRAHRLYLNKGFLLTSHHFALNLEQ